MRMCSRHLTAFPLVAAVLLLSLTFLAPPASAHPGLRVAGALLVVEVAPGQTFTHIMTVSIGETDPALDIMVAVKGFGQSLDGSFHSLEPSEDTSPYTARTFISLDKTSFHLDPGGSEEVSANISVPSDVGAGARYAIINIHTQPVGGGQVGIVSAVDVPVLLTISDTELTKTGTITEISVGNVTVGQPLVLSTFYKNTGNYYYKARNSITLTDEGGNEVAAISTPLTSNSIIPPYSHRFDVSIDQELPVGTYNVYSKVTLEDGTLLDERSISFEVTEPYVPPVSEVCITLTPGSAAVLQTPDGRVSISFPQGSVTSAVKVCLRSCSRAELPAPPVDYKLGATCFRIEGLPGLLAKEATVAVKYSTDDLEVAEEDGSRLSLAYWDEAEKEWVILFTQLNEDEKTLTTATNHLGVWTVMVAPEAISPPSPPAIPLLIGGIIAAVVLITFAAYYVIKRRSARASERTEGALNTVNENKGQATIYVKEGITLSPLFL